MMYNITHNDYSFSERADQDQWVVHLKNGPYENTYYTYGKITIDPPEGGWTDDSDDNVGHLRFTYGIIDAVHDKSELKESPDFNNYVAAVLQHILEDSFEKGDYRVGDDVRDDNTKELNQ